MKSKFNMFYQDDKENTEPLNQWGIDMYLHCNDNKYVDIFKQGVAAVSEKFIQNLKDNKED